MTDTLRELLTEALHLAGACAAEPDWEDEPREVRMNPISRAREYAAIRSDYQDAVEGAVQDYLDSVLPVTQFKNRAGRAVLEGFPEAFYTGYAASSGTAEVDREDDDWLTDRINTEVGFVADLFATLKVVREGDAFDAGAVAAQHAEAYARSLDGVYAEARLRGAKNIVLEFGGDDGAESCGTCTGLKGKRLRVRTILKRDLIPRPGNANFICGGWQCAHFWFDPRTGERYGF